MESANDIVRLFHACEFQELMVVSRKNSAPTFFLKTGRGVLFLNIVVLQLETVC